MRWLTVLVILLSFLYGDLEITSPPPAFIFENSSFSRNILITNRSEKFVRIIRVQPSCSCVRPSLSDEWISPKSTVRMKVDVAPPYSKKLQQQWYVRIYTNTDDSNMVMINAYLLPKKILKDIAKYIAIITRILTWTIPY